MRVLEVGQFGQGGGGVFVGERLGGGVEQQAVGAGLELAQVAAEAALVGAGTGVEAGRAVGLNGKVFEPAGGATVGGGAAAGERGSAGLPAGKSARMAGAASRRLASSAGRSEAVKLRGRAHTSQGRSAAVAVSSGSTASSPGPTLVPGDVVVRDNLPVHKVEGLAEIAQKHGPRLLYLPPHAPDFNPIELAFSKIKVHLRTASARTREALTVALQTALAWITAQDAENWFSHCGHHVH